METGRYLTIDSLPEKIRESGRELAAAGALIGAGSGGGLRTAAEEGDLKERRRKIELDAIIEALDKYGWDTKGKKNAAKSLGIGIATLYRILNK